jgi:DNA-binding IclR family transcriptional regulator|tara:strand:+ start:883 stop:1668 length:786 start_codon:yes stop_codon:yes gene_type:complete
MRKEERGILDRYIRILEALAASRSGLTLTELVSYTELSKGTLHRLIKSLMQVGLLAPRDGRKVYVVGPRFLRLLYMGAAPSSVSTFAQPILDDLAARFDQTAFVAQLFDSEVRSVAIALPNSENKASIQPGRIMPLHAAASAKAIWAFQEESLIDSVMKNDHPRYSKHTIVGKDAIRAELDMVRHQEFAVCDQELDHGVLSLACPVDIEGPGVIFSIAVVGTVQGLGQYPRDAVVSSLREAAKEFATSIPAKLKDMATFPL